MDNADGGRRGLRARPDPDLIQALRDHWELNGFAEAVDLGGSSSLNLLLGDGDRRYVVRVHRSSVTPERLDAIHQARGALLADGVPCAPVVPTRRGAPWIRLQGRLVEVEPYVDHDAVMDSWQCLEVGIALLARTHGVLPRVEVGEAGRRPPRQLGRAGRGRAGRPAASAACPWRLLGRQRAVPTRPTRAAGRL